MRFFRSKASKLRKKILKEEKRKKKAARTPISLIDRLWISTKRYDRVPRKVMDEYIRSLKKEHRRLRKRLGELNITREESVKIRVKAQALSQRIEGLKEVLQKMMQKRGRRRE